MSKSSAHPNWPPRSGTSPPATPTPPAPRDQRPARRGENGTHHVAQALHPCPKCKAAPASPCRSRSDAVTSAYRTGRFTKVPKSLSATCPFAVAVREQGRQHRTRSAPGRTLAVTGRTASTSPSVP
ncbi:zinc finger domain-containing protein [Streptomyces marokkonensis]|uniref:zinc finger domain-containing protein n=1 Tax=Streptomyces marokkonensis TaxID=324855 RepID=UPI003CCB66D1